MSEPTRLIVSLPSNTPFPPMVWLSDILMAGLAVLEWDYRVLQNCPEILIVAAYPPNSEISVTMNSEVVITP